jgi:hypothetical protein
MQALGFQVEKLVKMGQMAVQSHSAPKWVSWGPNKGLGGSKA